MFPNEIQYFYLFFDVRRTRKSFAWSKKIRNIPIRSLSWKLDFNDKYSRGKIYPWKIGFQSILISFSQSEQNLQLHSGSLCKSQQLWFSHKIVYPLPKSRTSINFSNLWYSIIVIWYHQCRSKARGSLDPSGIKYGKFYWQSSKIFPTLNLRLSERK